MSTSALAKGEQLLVAGPPVSLSLSLAHDPDAYYRTRSGLYVDGAFRSRVVTNAKAVRADTTFKVVIAELCQGASDEQVENALPKDHRFDESAVCAVAAAMMERQRDGRPGDLTITSYANLLYTYFFVIDVHWGAIRRRWRVQMWRRDYHKWRAGSRVLFPAN